MVAGRVYDEPVKMLVREVGEVEIVGEKDPTAIDPREAMQVSPISMEEVLQMPTINNSVEGFVKNLPGVSSNNEFSSQYQVRGGNFDENLVYVNGIEVYRPFLARAGQQEGLGFTNPALAQGLKFSTGGFGAQYGDRLSSVLDITYRQPKEFRATVEAGFITANLHVEGISKNKKDPEKPGRFTYLIGARRFAMSYLLNSLETRGDYRPSFYDLQGMFTFTPKSQAYEPEVRERKDGSLDTLYIPNEKVKFTGFLTATRNNYQFEPTSRQTTFGSIQQAFRLRTAFQGQEVSAYSTGMAALMLEHKPNVRWKFDYILSAFQTDESERFDVEGFYLLGEVNTNFGSDEFNESEFDLGVGSEYRHGRNYLTARVLSGQFRGQWNTRDPLKHKLLFGAKYQYQYVNDDLKEYYLLDSAGYVVNETGGFGPIEFIRGQAELPSNQFKAYVQHEWGLSDQLALISGLRVLRYDLTEEWLLAPRVQLLYQAKQQADGETRLRLRLAGGVYHQPPFYRELRRFDGSLNLGVNSQRSVHAIAGLDYIFDMWGRPFRLFSEAYYKWLTNLVPYEVQNVRIRYYPDEVATGAAYGLDMRLNGEFIKGIDSWVSLGLLKTSENIVGDERGAVPRPTDQRFTFAMYFQDELPINPTYKVHVNYIYGSGLRHGPPRDFENRTFFSFPPYHRLDIGFSKLISLNPSPGKRGIESIWATVEIFNLLQRQNTVSYVWIDDLQNRSYAVPNYLSARLLNVRVVFKFR